MVPHTAAVQVHEPNVHERVCGPSLASTCRLVLVVVHPQILHVVDGDDGILRSAESTWSALNAPSSSICAGRGGIGHVSMPYTKPKLEVAAAEMRWGWAAESLFSRTWKSSSLVRIVVVSASILTTPSSATGDTSATDLLCLHQLRPKHLS